MGIWDLVTDLAEAALPWSTVEAEAPAAEDQVRTNLGSSMLCTSFSGPSPFYLCDS